MSNESKVPSIGDLSRRSALKAVVAGLLAGGAAPALTHLSAAQAVETGAGARKILIAYYSRTGNTREIAQQIQKIAGGELFEIQPVQPYPKDYNAAVAQAKRELEADYRPKLKTSMKSIEPYQVVFVGYPNWWGTMPMPLFTFLARYNFSGKTILPFCTHEGSRLGDSVEDIKRLCPQATILDVIAVRGGSVKRAQNEVSGWLRKAGMTK